MLDAIATGVQSAISYVGQVLTALTSSSGALAGVLPVVGLAIGIALVGIGIRYLRSMIIGW